MKRAGSGGEKRDEEGPQAAGGEESGAAGSEAWMAKCVSSECAKRCATTERRRALWRSEALAGDEKRQKAIQRVSVKEVRGNAEATQSVRSVVTPASASRESVVQCLLHRPQATRSDVISSPHPVSWRRASTSPSTPCIASTHHSTITHSPVTSTSRSSLHTSP